MGTLSSWLLCLFNITHHFFPPWQFLHFCFHMTSMLTMYFPFPNPKLNHFPKIPHSLNYALVFRIKILVLGVLIATGVSLLLGPLKRKE